jgi:hypothetical protein
MDCVFNGPRRRRHPHQRGAGGSGSKVEGAWNGPIRQAFDIGEADDECGARFGRKTGQGDQDDDIDVRGPRTRRVADVYNQCQGKKDDDNGQHVQHRHDHDHLEADQ